MRRALFFGILLLLKMQGNDLRLSMTSVQTSVMLYKRRRLIGENKISKFSHVFHFILQKMQKL